MIPLAAAMLASSLAGGSPTLTLSTDGHPVLVLHFQEQETETKFRIRYGGCECVSKEPETAKKAAPGTLLVGAVAAEIWRRRRHAAART